MGVLTVSYGTDEFPAFFSPHSGVASTARMDDPTTVASAYWSARELGLSHGMLIAIPNDDPAGENVERAIQQALMDAEDQHIHGQALTPFILKEVAHQTAGDSLETIWHWCEIMRESERKSPSPLPYKGIKIA